MINVGGCYLRRAAVRELAGGGDFLGAATIHCLHKRAELLQAELPIAVLPHTNITPTSPQPYTMQAGTSIAATTEGARYVFSLALSKD